MATASARSDLALLAWSLSHPDTVDVTIPVETGTAAALRDVARRALVGRVVSRMLEPASVERLGNPIAALTW